MRRLALLAIAAGGWVAAAVAAVYAYREWDRGFGEGRAEGLYDGEIIGRRKALDELMVPVR